MITCSDCGAEVSPNARACPHCGNPTIQARPMSRKTLFALAGMTAGLFLLLAIGSLQHAQTKQDLSAELRKNAAEINRDFAVSKTTGLITDVNITGEYPDVFVTRDFGEMLLRQKRDFALTVYAYCALHNPATEVVYLRDAHSGETVGTVSRGTGLRLQ